MTTTARGSTRYPTDTVYRKGSFDITAVDLKFKGEKVEIAVTQNSPLEDKCWSMQFGFCVQMLFVFIQTDAATGHTEGLPGLNVQFAPGQRLEQGHPHLAAAGGARAHRGREQGRPRRCRPT